jgi:Tol biopolymer transport system component
MLAVVSQGRVTVVDLQGTTIAPGSVFTSGRILIADNRNPGRASLVWAMDARSGRIDRLNAEWTRKFLWGGTLTRDGKRAAFPNAQRNDLYVGDPAAPHTAVNVTQDEYLDFDPSWSPDESRLVYISSNPTSDSVCR